MTERNAFVEITALRGEVQRDIAEIHKRIDDIFGVLNKMQKPNNTGASWVRQSVGLTIAVVTLIGAFLGIVYAFNNQIQLQIGMVSDRLEKVEDHAVKDGHPIYHSATLKTVQLRMERIENRIEGQITNLDEKLQLEINQVDESARLRSERVNARFTKLEEWQRWWYRNHMNEDLGIHSYTEDVKLIR